MMKTTNNSVCSTFFSLKFIWMQPRSFKKIDNTKLLNKIFPLEKMIMIVYWNIFNTETESTRNKYENVVVSFLFKLHN
jgi:hypothetical protein